jgi:hypothetical protein
VALGSITFVSMAASGTGRLSGVLSCGARIDHPREHGREFAVIMIGRRGVGWPLSRVVLAPLCAEPWLRGVPAMTTTPHLELVAARFDL